MSLRPSWFEYLKSLSEEDYWGHCRSNRVHDAHPTTVFTDNETPTRTTCPGTPPLRVNINTSQLTEPVPSWVKSPLQLPPLPTPNVFSVLEANTPTRPSWDQYFMTLVDAAATRASCNRGKSGAVFVRDNDVLSTGYVGAPPGLPDCYEVGHLFRVSSTGDTGIIKQNCVRTIHAEQNGILRAARNGVSLRDSTLYCTMEPCTNCAMSLLALEVKRVVAKNRYLDAERTRKMFTQSGIILEVYSTNLLYDA